MRKFLIVAVIVVAVGWVLYSWLFKGDDTEEEGPRIIEVQAERGPLRLAVSSTGRVASNLDVEIKCKASGEVISLPFDISDVVKVDDLVVELDPVDEQRNVSKADVSLSASKARLIQSEQNLRIAIDNLGNAHKFADVNLESAQIRADDARAKADRMKELYDRKLVGFEEYESAETTALRAERDVETARIQLEELEIDEAALELRRQDVVLAKADVQSAQISLSIARQRLEDTKVYAPIDGVVTARFVQSGQIISSGISNTSGGTPVLTLSDLSRLFVLASVDESDIGNVQAGQRAVITADAYPGRMFTGMIERVAQRGVNTSNVVTFEVRIEVTGKDKSMLKPEMTANVEIIIIEKEDALTLPVNAVSRIKGKHIVTVRNEDGSTEEREVEIGINNGERIEIISGLNEDDIVIIDMGAMHSQWSRGGGSQGSNPMRLMGGSRGRH